MIATTALPSLPLICALLRDELPAWPEGADDDYVEELLRAARYHGVTPLLDAKFSNRCLQSTWPEAIRLSCHADAVAQAMRELATRAETNRLLAALGSAELVPLIMKGTGLASSHYPSPVFRPRADCDLLVAPSDREAARKILLDLGYRRIAGPAGAYVGYQCGLHYDDPRGVGHNVDLHWRISDEQSFAWLFTFDELSAAAVPVPALGPNARRLGDVHALILSLLHRAGNNQFIDAGLGDRLIWLYDVHLLVEAITADDLARFRRIAQDKRIVAIAIQGLRSCVKHFGSPRVEALCAELEKSPAAESGADLLRAGKLAREWLELRAIPTAWARAMYLANRVLPSRDYMRERFPDSPDRALPILHARRWLEGIGKRWPARQH